MLHLQIKVAWSLSRSHQVLHGIPQPCDRFLLHPYTSRCLTKQVDLFDASMDPLSVSMAIVGLLTAAQQISSAIGNLVSRGKSAPKEIQNVKSTVDTIRAVLLQLQLLLLGRTKVDRQRTSLILVEQVVITLSACVATFSELDVFVGALDSDHKLGLMDRIRWATKTTTIQEHLQKLEMHKSSLTLMMTILTW